MLTAIDPIIALLGDNNFCLTRWYQTVLTAMPGSVNWSAFVTVGQPLDSIVVSADRIEATGLPPRGICGSRATALAMSSALIQIR